MEQIRDSTLRCLQIWCFVYLLSARKGKWKQTRFLSKSQEQASLLPFPLGPGTISRQWMGSGQARAAKSLLKWDSREKGVEGKKEVLSARVRTASWEGLTGEKAEQGIWRVIALLDGKADLKWVWRFLLRAALGEAPALRQFIQLSACFHMDCKRILGLWLRPGTGWFSHLVIIFDISDLFPALRWD